MRSALNVPNSSLGSTSSDEKFMTLVSEQGTMSLFQSVFVCKSLLTLSVMR